MGEKHVGNNYVHNSHGREITEFNIFNSVVPPPVIYIGEEQTRDIIYAIVSGSSYALVMTYSHPCIYQHQVRCYVV